MGFSQADRLSLADGGSEYKSQAGWRDDDSEIRSSYTGSQAGLTEY